MGLPLPLSPLTTQIEPSLKIAAGLRNRRTSTDQPPLPSGERVGVRGKRTRI